MIEERRYCTEKVEARAGEGNVQRVMFGHASVFNRRSKLIGGAFEEIIRPGAFTDVLRRMEESTDEVCCSFFQHDEKELLATTLNRSLRLQEDKIGLYQETDLLGDTTSSRNMIAHMDAKRVNAMSFAFRAPKDGQKWRLDDNGIEVREVFVASKLKDVSPVTHPAYNGTDLGIRSEAGKVLDFDTLARLIIRAENGLRMSKTELETMKEFRAALEKYCEGKDEGEQDINPVPLSLAEAKRRYSDLLGSA